MSLKVFPTNIGGVSLNSALSPLAALLNQSGGVQSMTYPSDLGSNPAMGHAVIFQAYDYTTELQQQGNATVRTAMNEFDKVAASSTEAVNNLSFNNFAQTSVDVVTGVGKTLLEGVTTIGYLTQAPNYTRQKKGSSLASISLFMPDSLSVNYTSGYGEVSMTDELGTLGYVGNAISDAKHKDGWLRAITPYAIGTLTGVLGKVSGENVGKMASQALGQVSNPQIQLLYRGIDLRTFQLEFVMTPKSSAEAQTIKDICDTFTFYSLPGIAGAQVGGSGQFLTPPQLFSVQFKFLGQNSIVGNIANIFSSALANSGLGFLASGNVVSNGNSAKVFTVGDCVLESVGVNYTPNGWAAHNDGHAVQTVLTLQFKETQMLTKQYFNNTKIAQNYSSMQQQNDPVRNQFNEIRE